MMVREVFEQEGLTPANVKLGEVELPATPTAAQTDALRTRLAALGFELLDNQKQKTIAQIKTAIQDLLTAGSLDEHHKFSELLATTLQKDYTYLSKLFSEVEGITIEKYVINQKIEKVKEWMLYDQLSLNDIAFRLGYSSVAHLSAQFKKVTGITPGAFRQMKVQPSPQRII